MASALGYSTIDDQLTFSVDAGNPASWSPNVHPSPLDIFGWSGSGGNNATISRDTTVTDSPVGGIPLKMVVSGADPHITTTNTYIAPAANAQTWTISVYAKASIATTGQLFILGLNSSNTYIEAPSTTINITTNWQRFTFTTTFGNASTVGIAIRLDGPDAGGSPTIWWDGLQLEQSSSATTFNSMGNPTRKWYDLSENKIHLSPTGTINFTTLGGARCFGFNSSMYWSSTTTDAQKTDYRYGATIELWLYNQTKAARRTVFEKAGNTYQSYEQELAMTWETANDISCYRAYNPYDSGSSGALTNNAWNHVVLVLNPHLSPGQWYLNGVASGSYSQSARQLPPKANEIRIGGGYAGTVDAGGVAVVRTYSRMFDLEDVLQNYNASKQRFGL
jgi:hypothetical protein